MWTAALALTACMLALTGSAWAQENDDRVEARARAATLAVADVEFSATNHVVRLLGGPVEGTLTMVVTNHDFLPARDVVGTVRVGSATWFTPPVDLEPGETAQVSMPAELGGMSFLERDIVVAFGTAEAFATHRTIPWLLVALVAFVANMGLIAGRDNLRAAARRRMEVEGQSPLHV